jgi:hypothetical protein
MMLDIFDSDAYSLLGMTALINALPEVPTKIGDLGIFEEFGVDTTSVLIERQDEGLSLVATSPRGGVGETVGGGSRTLRRIDIPHFQRDDAITADEVLGKRAFGTTNVFETIDGRLNQKLARHTRSFDFTLENMRVGAIQGKIYDKDGTTVLLDCYQAFGITPNAATNFDLGNANADILGNCQKIQDGIEDALEGQNVMRVIALCGDQYLKKLWENPKVSATYQNWNAAVALRGDPRLPFEYGGISWMRYHTRPKAKAARKGAALVADNQCIFIPVGVPELFITRFGPADYEETVNTIGLPRYAQQIPMRNNKGRELEMQMNAISLCTRPEAIFPGVTNS